MAAAEDDRAARLLERLLTDAELRARFRRDPAAVAREAQLEKLAGDFSGGSAMQTLEARESRSSLAGVMMAAALEGIAGVGLAHHAAGSGQGLPREVHRVLARHEDQQGPAAPAGHVASVASPSPADLATPEGAAADQAASQADGTWSSGGPGDAGVFPVVDPDHASHAGATDPLDGTDAADDGSSDVAEDGGSGDTEAEADQESDGDDGEDEGGDGEDDGDDEPDEDEPDDSNDALDESTHDQDSGGDDGDGGDSAEPAAPAPPADDGDLADLSAPIDETDGGAAGAISPYPGDQAPQAEIATWMGREARRRGLPPELPVMASLVESSLHNLDHGDRDSEGFFQMRLGIWNNGRYAGYPDKPELQLQWFLDKALEVKQQRVAQGRSVDDPSQYGEWIADVERPAAPYRGRYQLRLDDAEALLRNGGSGGGSGHDAADLADAVATGGGVHAGPQGRAAIDEAEKYLGTPYRWGGSSPQTGFDCSGLVQWAFAKVGVRIPRTTDLQFAASNGQHIGRRDLLPGDVVFFRDSTGYIHHEGIYLGNDKFLHAPHTGDVVKVSSLDESYYAQQFAGGRRFAAAERVVASSAASDRAPAVAARSVRAAMSAAARDATEARRPGTLLFQAVRDQETRKAAIRYPDDD